MQWRRDLIIVVVAALALLTAGTVAAQDSGPTVVEMSAGVPLTVQAQTLESEGAVEAPVSLTIQITSMVAIRGDEAAVVVETDVAELEENAGLTVTLGDVVESDVTMRKVAAEESSVDAALGSAAPEGSEPEPVVPAGPTANRNANLRGGPGTNYAVVGSAKDGQALVPVGKNADGSWYVLEDDRWIAAFLVDNAPAGLPVVQAPPAPKPAPAPATAADDSSDPASVIEAATAAIAQSPNDAEAYYFRGLAYYEIDNYDKAMQDFTKAIQLDPGLSDAYGWRGVIYLDRGNYSNAIQDFTQVIQRDPSLAEAYALRGLANGMAGNVDQAIQDFERALQLGVSGEMRSDIEEMLGMLRGQ